MIHIAGHIKIEKMNNINKLILRSFNVDKHTSRPVAIPMIA